MHTQTCAPAISSRHELPEATPLASDAEAIRTRKRGKSVCSIVAMLIALSCTSQPLMAGPRVARIQAEHTLVCGVSDDTAGFAKQSADGQWTGFETDLCRAIAAAMLGPDAQVDFRKLADVHDYLADERIDIVFHRLTWTLTREAPGQLEFGPIYFHDEPLDMGKEPLAPLLRSDDPDFARIVRWTVYALIEAEELGIGASSPAALPDWPPEATGPALGLSPSWARQAVLATGNYAELYDRHFGPQTALARPRGLNRLWKDGGLLLAPPLR